MRISREYRVWPVYARDADMVYAIGRDSATNSSIDLSDTHSRLGRMAITRRAALSDEIVLAVVLAETPTQIADALTTALSVPADPQSGASAAPASAPPAEIPAGGDASAVDEPSADTESSDVGDPTAAQETAPDNDPPAAVQRDTRSRRAAGGAKAVFVPHGSPAAVLDTDGLWLADGTRVELTEPIVHVGQAAELAYSHNIGYQLTPKFCEPGQIWITEQACQALGIEVKAISRRDRAKSLRQLTEGIDFVTLAVNEGWSLGGAGEDPNAHRLGTWTRVYLDDKREVMIALIPGMGAGPDEMPILADEPTPAQIAYRLQLLAGVNLAGIARILDLEDGNDLLDDRNTARGEDNAALHTAKTRRKSAERRSHP